MSQHPLLVCDPAVLVLASHLGEITTELGLPAMPQPCTGNLWVRNGVKRSQQGNRGESGTFPASILTHPIALSGDLPELDFW